MVYPRNHYAMNNIVSNVKVISNAP